MRLPGASTPSGCGDPRTLSGGLLSCLRVRFGNSLQRPGYFLQPLRGIGVAAILIVFCGCSHSRNSMARSTPPLPTTGFKAPGTDPWKLTWNDEASASPAVLWNGNIGFRIGPLGNGLDAQGKSLPFFWAANYEQSGQERLRPSPSPLTTAFTLSGSGPGKCEIKDWSQSLDMSNGKIETSYTEHYDDNDVRVVTISMIDPRRDSIGQQWVVSPTKDATLFMTLDFSGQKIRVQANAIDLGSPKIAQVIYSSSPTIQALTKPDLLSVNPIPVSLKGGQSFTLSSALNFYNDEELMGYWLQIGPQGTRPVKIAGDRSFDEIARASTSVRVGDAQPDIEIDGPIEDQQAIRSFIYYLRGGVDRTVTMSKGLVSPFGMSNDLYNGHVFWDADVWDFPALAFIDPDAAKVIPDYRLAHTSAASDNYDAWMKAGRPTADPKYKPSGIFENSELGLKFPWESSVSGKETGTGPSQFEDHISGDVAFSLSMAESLGIASPRGTAGFVTSMVGAFYRQRSQLRQGGTFDIKGTMSPDENHVGDNDLYTNLLAQWCSNGGDWMLKVTDYLQVQQFNLPKDKTSFLTYDNDQIKGYKQAAAILAIYPLQYPPAEAQAKVMMDRFADKVISDGPAMSDSIDAVIWARIGDTDKAYDAWRHGWMDYVRPPFLLFSEKKNSDRTYFTTGAAGELQSVIYGFLGFRIDSKPEAGASWSLKLKGDRWLSIKPNLPKAWKRVTFRNFHVLGKTYTLTATHQSVQVTQGD